MDEVQYTLTQDDFWHLQLNTFLRRQRRTVRLRLILLSVMLICLFIFLDHHFSGNYILSTFSLFVALFVALFIVLLFLGLSFLLMRLVASLCHKRAKKAGVHALTISEQGVQHSNEISNGTSSWQAYKAIEEDKHNIYFVIDRLGPISMSILIPKSAFESPSQAEHFIARARGYWQEQAG